MSNMFCFQCQQTAGNSGCIRTGVCGKQPETSNLQDKLVSQLITLAKLTGSSDGSDRPGKSDRLIVDGLFTTLTNVNFDDRAITEFTERVTALIKEKGGSHEAEINLWDGDTDIVSLRSTLLFGLKGMSAYAHHAYNLGHYDKEVSDWFYKGLEAVSCEHTAEEWLSLILEFGKINLKCMELLDRANTGAFGQPVPTSVNTDIKKGPFIVVSGHDLQDMHLLLE